MAVDTSIIGKPTGARKVRVERGPVEFFARSLLDDNPVYHDGTAAAAAGFDGIPAPPTFSFVMGHQGTRVEEQPPDPSGGQNPMPAGSLRAFPPTNSVRWACTWKTSRGLNSHLIPSTVFPGRTFEPGEASRGAFGTGTSSGPGSPGEGAA